ncbi:MULTISPECIES: hypothetical protein [Halococcus]|uniref:Cthe-2314-like HEPN domain-containing protein n=1 Tax=Halococcus salifodinae DSM 8989 TaxID=1227456 RepID=M0MTJ2_9EURY|nr:MULTISPECIES: hypothetical protein [Halococcus]EMA48663.1 hypothetical protein C450_19039 [Halococcus salifodinae DSM 8989]
MEDDPSAYDGYGEVFRGSLRNDPEQEIKSLRDQTLECIEQFDVDDVNEDGRYFMSPDESTQLFTYFTMVAAVIEELSIGLLAEVLTDTETSSVKSSSEFFERKLTQERRQNLLLHTGIIDEGTHGEMEKLRNHRNTIVHSYRQRKFVRDLDETRDMINGGYRVTERLWGKFRDVQ